MHSLAGIKNSIASLRAHKLRSFLTMLGMIIGIAAVIIVMSVGAGAQSLILNQIQGVGSNLIGVLPGAAEENGPPASAFGIVVTTLKYEDGLALAETRNVPNVTAVASYVQGVATAQYRDVDYSVTFIGTTASYPAVEDMELAAGNFFTQDDERSLSRVAVLGSEVAKDFFGTANPIGQEIKIKRELFKVIGVAKERGTVFFVNQDDKIFIPIRTAQKILLGIDHVSFIRAKVDSVGNIDRALEDVKATLRVRHDIENPAEDDFSVRNVAAAADAITQVTDGLTFFLAAIAAIALVVGGVGIMNTMLVAVNERIREIGLRKAVGASRLAILRQFLTETIVISATGGIVGVITGSVISGLIALVARVLGYEWDFEVSVFSIALSTGFSLAIGVVFGIYPALKAAKLDPITALRYE